MADGWEGLCKLQRELSEEWRREYHHVRRWMWFWFFCFAFSIVSRLWV